MYETSTPESELARLLAGFPTISQLDVALKAGRLPINSESRRIIDIGLFQIKNTLSVREGVKPETVKVFKTLADASDVLAQVPQTDAGREAVSIMEEEAIWHPRVEVTKHRKDFNELSEAATLYYHLYSRSASRPRRRRDHENRLLYDLYWLYKDIKIAAGGRPGIADPLYRFTKECMALLGERLGMSGSTFRMRIQRIKSKRLEGIGSLASVL